MNVAINKRWLFLASFDESSHTDNFTRIPAAFEVLGGSCVRATHDSLFAVGTRLLCRDEEDVVHSVSSFDSVWIFGFGGRKTFLDRIQLLATIEPRQFVNTPLALLFAQTKGVLGLNLLAEFSLPTYVSQDATFLQQIVGSGGEWVLKPNSSSFGRRVFVLEKEDVNLSTTIESVCSDGYACIQPKIDTSNEKRILLCNGQVIGAYAKQNSTFRKNLATGSIATKADLSEDETAIVQKIAFALTQLGIGFAAIDYAHPSLLDVNLVNPGFLQTYEDTSGEDLSSDVVRALVDAPKVLPL